jgi:hypothetical protein
MQVDYLVDMDLVGKRVEKASNNRSNHNEIVAKRYRVYERYSKA